MPQPQSPAAAWLHRNWNEMRGFNFQWVASAGEGWVAADPDLGVLMAEIRRRGLQDVAAYAFVDFDEEIGEGGMAQEKGA